MVFPINKKDSVFNETKYQLYTVFLTSIEECKHGPWNIIVAAGRTASDHSAACHVLASLKPLTNTLARHPKGDDRGYYFSAYPLIAGLRRRRRLVLGHGCRLGHRSHRTHHLGRRCRVVVEWVSRPAAVIKCSALGNALDGIGERSVASGVIFPGFGFREEFRSGSHRKGLRIESFLTSRHDSGIDTGAPSRARGESTATAVAMRSFRR